MSENILVRLLEHNNWANLQVFDACKSLKEEQLDFQPQSAVRGTIRETLQHLVLSQEDYASMLTKFNHPPERELAALPDHGPCIRCIFEDIPSDRVETCAEAGVLGPVVGVLGALLAALALRALRQDDRIRGEIFAYDALGPGLRRTRVRPRPDCPRCAGTIDDLAPERYRASCATP
jgi:hypothetical protein